MMLAMFAGEHRDDWDDLLPAVMMVYRSSIHESTGFSPYHLMFGEECNLPLDAGLPRRSSETESADPIQNPYALWVRYTLERVYDQVCLNAGQAVRGQKRLYDQQAVKRIFTVGDWTMGYYPRGKKCKLDSLWLGSYLVVSLCGWAVGIQLQPDSTVLFVHCQDLKKTPQPRGPVSWLPAPDQPELGASTVAGSAFCSAASSVTGLPSVPSLPRPPSDPASGLPVMSPLPPPPFGLAQDMCCTHSPW